MPIVKISSIFIAFLLLPGVILAQDATQLKDLFKKGYIQVSGKSQGKQSRFQALRSAELTAQRDLLQLLQKVILFNAKTLKEDVTPTEIEGFLKGAVNCGQFFDAQKGIAEVCLKLNLRGQKGLYDSILPFLQDRKIRPPFQMVYAPDKTHPASRDHNSYDGVILDVRHLAFQPALFNRILTEQNTIVFDPLGIKTGSLIEYGCGGYVSEPGEAQEALRRRGSTNPLLLTINALEQTTDVKITATQAAELLAADQANEVLAQAKIVFLLQE